MGVPGFFAYLWKKYRSKKFVFNKSNKFKDMHFLVKKNSRLYLDTNCAIHPVCFKILSENENFQDYNELHRKMILAVIDYINYLYEFTQPKDLFYISIDGVAPSAKLKQQRSRRFKSVKEKNLMNSIKKKHGKEIKPFWTNSCISPGTKFMENLTLHITEYCKNLKKLNPNLEIIFSTSNSPSEGEHKILQHIRNNPTDNNENIMIYGLDADLIFLALSTAVNNIYLLRESTDMEGGNATDGILNYTSVDIMKECILLEFNSYFTVEEKEGLNLDKAKIIDDFIFICYFLGNDFLPHVPSLDIRMYSKDLKNGIDLLIEVYTDIFKEKREYMILKNPVDINLPILILFINKLAVYEKNFFIKKSQMRTYRRRCNSNEPYDKEVHKIQNLQFNIKDPIRLGKDTEKEWKYRYYNHYFHSSFNQAKFIKEICYQYFIGLYWIAHYYFDKCISWSWYYPFEHSPLISDLAIHIKTFDKFENVNFELNQPLNQFEQLLLILPKESNFLLPKNLRHLMIDKKSDLQHLYPRDYELDYLDKSKYWQTIPNLPNMDINLIKKIYRKIKIDKKYINRNKCIDPINFK